MSKARIGEPLERLEDGRFLIGAGQYIDDVVIPGEAYAVFVRSPHAHARIVSIDVKAARERAGVLGVFTGADLIADGIGSMPPAVTLNNRDGSHQAIPHRPVMPVERVLYVGEPVVVVVAETRETARDAAELVELDYEPLPAAIGLDAATTSDTPDLWDSAPANVCLDWEIGDEQATNAAFETAAHVTTLALGSNRVSANPMETRGAIGDYDPGNERYTLHVSSQGVHKLKGLVAKDVLRIAEADLRVLTPDVGGGFGMKIFLYSEYGAVLWAARTIGRAVKWIGDRAESFVSDAHARDHQTRAELALDAAGKFLALRVSTLANLGGYLSTHGAYIPTGAGCGVLSGLYVLPAIYCHMQCVFTNTVPTDAYRGAGKPEANFVLERLVDTAAREIGMSPSEIRRINLVPESAMPFDNGLGHTFDSGAFEENLDLALAAADWEGLPERREDAVKRGKRRGIGISAYFENAAGHQEEQARIHVSAEGRFSAFIGTQSNGQGHETTFAQVIASELGIGVSQVRLVQGDSDSVTHGRGTGGSRSLMMGGAALLSASEKVREKAKSIAAHLLEVAPADVDASDGRFNVAGTDLSISFSEVANAAYRPAMLPPGMDAGLEAIGVGMPLPPSFPNGFHCCEVEVDPETGASTIVRYTVVDDFGHIINPVIVKGQVHGGTTQGIGQALLEDCCYEPESGQLLAGTFMDYCMPRADDLPNFDITFNCIPCTTNPLGVKGCGEAGTIAAPAAVVNAIVDALAQEGVRHVAMPTTPQRVWEALCLAKYR